MPVQFGKYLLQHKLAEGGMAEIFLARQVGLEGFERPVVVKRLLPQHNAEEEFIRMFLNEARLAARLNHPNIVQIFALGQEEDTYFLAMEYIRGEDLRALAETADRLKVRPPLGLICRIIIDALTGLHYAHTRTGPDGRPLGLVHRDISPQNILVTYDGRVKVIDFGIAKATQARNTEQTQAGLLKGKYAYMSPEQTRGDKLDARSDVFAAGILLWELCTWRRLFKRSTDLATLVAISDERAPAMSLINPEVPAELDDVVLKSLSVEPEDRYASAQEFAEALEDVLLRLDLESDNRALGQFMRELFKDKLDQQLARAREAGFGTVEEYLLSGKAGESGDPGGKPSAPREEIKELPLQGLPGKAPTPRPTQRPTPAPVLSGVETVVAQTPRPTPTPTRQPTGVQAAVQPIMQSGAAQSQVHSGGYRAQPGRPTGVNPMVSSGGYSGVPAALQPNGGVPRPSQGGRMPTGPMPVMHSGGVHVSGGAQVPGVQVSGGALQASNSGYGPPVLAPGVEFGAPSYPGANDATLAPRAYAPPSPPTGEGSGGKHRRVIIAVVVGLLCGVLAVALLMLLDR